MNKKVFVTVLAMLFVLTFVFAQTAFVAKPISRLHLIGTGIAINSENPMDFMHAKASVGSVKIRNNESDTNFSVKRLGVLLLDGDKFVLKTIAIENEEISADVYERGVEEAVGEIYLARYEKLGRDVWAGELSLKGTLYNIYFIGLKRHFKPLEAAEKLSDYCEENPEDEKCNKAAVQCKENPRACRAKVLNYCKDNPEDEKCLDLKSTYCLKNASDVRCREYLLERCNEDSELPFCKTSKLGSKNFVSIHPGAVNVVTAEQGETLEAMKRKVKAVRNRWKPLVGGDNDEHGCIPSAGYTWCEAKEKCLRRWEENCPSTDDVVTGTAGGAGQTGPASSGK